MDEADPGYFWCGLKGFIFGPIVKKLPVEWGRYKYAFFIFLYFFIFTFGALVKESEVPTGHFGVSFHHFVKWKRSCLHI